MTMAPDIDFEKELSTEVNFELNSEVNIVFDKYVNVNVEINQEVCLSGNFAQATFSVEAVGQNTLAEADVHVLTTDGLSSVDGSLTSAVG